MRTLRRRDWLLAALLAVTTVVAVGGFAVRQIPGRGVVGEVPPSLALASGASAPQDLPPPADPTFDGHFRAGVLLLQAGRHGEAIAMLETARQLRPHVPEVHVNLGFAHLGRRDFRAAETAFTRAVEIRPRQANAYYGLAESLEAQGDIEGALGAMRTYVHLTPETDPFHRRGLSALWELEEALAKRRSAGLNAGEVVQPGETR
jgi:tetratricopeptide (TPR) repeat protein